MQASARFPQKMLIFRASVLIVRTNCKKAAGRTESDFLFTEPNANSV